ncbi:hypothetical protein PR048_028199, partial [Dryococelus australis]
MTMECFDEMLCLIGNYIHREDKNFRESNSPEEHLVFALRKLYKVGIHESITIGFVELLVSLRMSLAFLYKSEVQSATIIVMATVILHNFLREKRSDAIYFEYLDVPDTTNGALNNIVRTPKTATRFALQ